MPIIIDELTNRVLVQGAGGVLVTSIDLCKALGKYVRLFRPLRLDFKILVHEGFQAGAEKRLLSSFAGLK